MAGATSDPNPTTLHNHTSPSSFSANDNNNKLYKGVRKRKWGKWVSEIRLPNSRERIWLGSYDSPDKAARAFDAALYCLRGRHANFNFPDTPQNLEIINNVSIVAAAADKSLTPQEIQEIAAKFANENQPQRGDINIDAANSFGGSSTCTSTITTNITASSSSTNNIYEYDDGILQVENGDMMTKMDWTFLNELDHHDVPVGSDYYGLYSDLDKMHSGDQLLYSTPLQTPFDDNVDQIEVDDDPFSHQSFLWNWNF